MTANQQQRSEIGMVGLGVMGRNLLLNMADHGCAVAGYICDFMMDVPSWAIRQLVIKTGHRFSGKEVQIATSTVDRISYEESTVFVKLTQEAVEQSPQHHLDPVGVAA